MLFRTLKCLLILSFTLGLLTLPQLSLAQEAPGAVLNFSAGWRTNDAKPENVLQLGVMYSCPAGWCVQFEEYQGHLNIQRTPLKYRHEMREVTHSRNCTDEMLTTVFGKKTQELEAKVAKNSEGYIVDAGGYKYEWKRDSVDLNSYSLSAVSLLARPGDLLSQPVGFSYWSEDIRGFKFERPTFDAYFDGNIAHKDTLTGVEADWAVSRTSIDFRKFSDSGRGTPVLGYTQAGAPEVLKRLKKEVQVQQSVLPPPPSMDRLRYFNHEYGHDFNANGCFDEFGHNKLMMPVVHSGMVSALVFIEYTYDKFDGVPMLSVGRYFRREKR